MIAKLSYDRTASPASKAFPESRPRRLMYLLLPEAKLSARAIDTCGVEEGKGQVDLRFTFTVHTENRCGRHTAGTAPILSMQTTGLPVGEFLPQLSQ